MENNYQEHIQQLENQIKSLEIIVNSNAQNINKTEMNYQVQTKKIKNQIKSLDFIVDDNVQNINKMEMNYQEHIQQLEVIKINIKTILDELYHLKFNTDFVTQTELEYTILACGRIHNEDNLQYQLAKKKAPKAAKSHLMFTQYDRNQPINVFHKCLVCPVGEFNDCHYCGKDIHTGKDRNSGLFISSTMSLGLSRIIRINKKYYYYNETLMSDTIRYGMIINAIYDSGTDTKIKNAITNMHKPPNGNPPTPFYECGRLYVDTNEVIWH